MSPQGLQAQSVLHKIKQYSPKRDTSTKALLRLYKKQASQYTQSGVLPENERRYFVQEFSPFGV